MTAPPRLADFLREKMAAAGLTPSALAEQVGVNPAAVSHWLAGRNVIASERIADVAAELGLSREDALELHDLCAAPVSAVIAAAQA